MNMERISTDKHINIVLLYGRFMDCCSNEEFTTCALNCSIDNVIDLEPDFKLHIRKRYYSHKEPLGLCVSCWTSIPGWSNPRVDWIGAVAIKCTWES